MSYVARLLPRRFSALRMETVIFIGTAPQTTPNSQGLLFLCEKIAKQDCSVGKNN